MSVTSRLPPPGSCMPSEEGEKRHRRLYGGCTDSTTIVEKHYANLLPITVVKGVARAPVIELWSAFHQIIDKHPGTNACDLDLSLVIRAIHSKFNIPATWKNMFELDKNYVDLEKDFGFVTIRPLIALLLLRPTICHFITCVRGSFLRQINFALIRRLNANLFRENKDMITKAMKFTFKEPLRQCLGSWEDTLAGDMVLKGFQFIRGFDRIGETRFFVEVAGFIEILASFIEFLAQNDRKGSGNDPKHALSFLQLQVLNHANFVYDENKQDCFSIIDDVGCRKISESCDDKELNVITYINMQNTRLISLNDLIVRAGVYRARMPEPSLYSTERKSLKKLVGVCEKIMDGRMEVKDMTMDIDGDSFMFRVSSE